MRILTSNTCFVFFVPQELQMLDDNEYSLQSFLIAEPFDKTLRVSIPSSSIQLDLKIFVSPVKWVLKACEGQSNDAKVRNLMPCD